MRLAALDRSDARRDDGPRRVEIRFADLEVNDVAALRFESARTREDLECCLGAEPPHPARERAHEPSLDLALDAGASFEADECRVSRARGQQHAIARLQRAVARLEAAADSGRSAAADRRVTDASAAIAGRLDAALAKLAQLLDES